jgi:hypothetical protein
MFVVAFYTEIIAMIVGLAASAMFGVERAE